MTQEKRIPRRNFLATAAGAFAVPYVIPSSALGLGGAVAPSERITIGTIGCGGMGRGNTRGFLRQGDTQVVAVCDVDRKHLDQTAEMVNKHYESDDCAKYTDYRQLLAREDIDAVCIATPDHWHALCSVAAADAKKDIYCQKPMTHTFAGGQALVAAVEKNGVVFQVGSQQRSQRNFRQAAQLLRNGHIGKVKHVEVGLPTGHQAAKGDTAVKEPPANLDYDFWCGPSPKLPYVAARVHWNWRWHLSYGGGQLMDWIGHHNDIAHWGLDMDRSGPVEVKALEFEYPEDRSVWNAAWKYEIWCKYEGGITTSISNHHERGCRWIGEDGWIFVARGKIRASNPEWLRREYDAGPTKLYESAEHHRNFLDCVKSRKPCICPAETGHRSITPGHLGLASEALGGRTIRWDPRAEKVLGDPEAEKVVKRADFRSPWL
ncbi:MAG: Gfo/Idh/MocA family oxidoreductase, partial [Planctomycetota bacterium]|nr:Gfo/Idh/MocA family oxidoreductase [Planctomycetota bacterium]